MVAAGPNTVVAIGKLLSNVKFKAKFEVNVEGKRPRESKSLACQQWTGQQGGRGMVERKLKCMH